MKLKEIRIEQTHNLGNYENVKLAITAELDEGDDPSAKIELIKKYIDFKLKFDERSTKYEQFKRTLDADNVHPDKRIQLNKFIQKYEAMVTEMQELEFNVR